MILQDMDSSQDSCESCIELKGEYAALQLKNRELVQKIASQMMENAELQKTIDYLQQENFEIKSKFNSSKNIVNQIEFAAKSFVNELKSATDAFTPILHLCAMSSSANKTSSVTQTQAVKPSIVNGHVLHSPTISLTRMSNNAEALTELLNLSQQQTNNSDEEMMSDDEQGVEENYEEQEEQVEERNRRLDTIVEADSNMLDLTPPGSPPSNNNIRTRDIRIYLSPLSQSVLERAGLRKSSNETNTSNSNMSPYRNSSISTVLKIKLEQTSCASLINNSSISIKQRDSSVLDESSNNNQSMERTPVPTRRRQSLKRPVYANMSSINYSYASNRSTDANETNTIETLSLHTSTPISPKRISTRFSQVQASCNMQAENTFTESSFQKSKFVTRRRDPQMPAPSPAKSVLQKSPIKISRPKRAAKPTTLREPKLNKKMRRSR